MENNETKGVNWLHSFMQFFLFLTCGLAIFLPDALSSEIPNRVEIPLRIGLSILFLILSIALHFSVRLKRYRLVFFAFFIASTAMFIDWHYSQWAAQALNIDPDSPEGYALDKLESTMLLVLTILLLNKFAGGNLSSLYLKRGKVRMWLIIGMGTFLVFAFSSVWMAETLFKGKNLSMERILPWTPWVLLFVLANGLNEELLFRGLFLQKFEPFLGAISSNFLIALIFVLWHIGADYSADLLIFGGILFVLALLWGWLMQWSDSLWGSVFFHAGADIPVILGILSEL